MGRRQRRRGRDGEPAAERAPADTTEYTDPDGNVLVLRERLSAGTLRQLDKLGRRPAATADDLWQRREELLGRYRMADSETRAWVRRTIDEHLRAKQPEALD